jgi:hypothetical protein
MSFIRRWRKTNVSSFLIRASYRLHFPPFFLPAQPSIVPPGPSPRSSSASGRCSWRVGGLLGLLRVLIALKTGKFGGHADALKRSSALRLLKIAAVAKKTSLTPPTLTGPALEHHVIGTDANAHHVVWDTRVPCETHGGTCKTLLYNFFGMGPALLDIGCRQ